MADPTNVLEFDPRLNAPGIPEAQPTTPVQAFAESLGQFKEAGARRVEGLRTSAARGREEAADVRRMAGEHEKAAAAARPEPLELKPPPSLEARPFLMPGKGFLNEIQTAIIGAGQMVLGVGGLKGRGHAIAAVAGLKGALEGWQAGDRERADSSLREWQAASKALLENHRSRREAYQDLLTDQNRSMDTRLREIGIQARIDGQMDLANAAEQGNIGEVINILTQREIHADNYALKNRQFDVAMAKYEAQRAFQERVHTDLERQRGIVNKRLQEGLDLRKQNQAGMAKLEKEDDGISASLRNMDALEESVRRLDAKGIIPKGATAADKLKATVALQTSFGDTEVAQDIENVKRLGTALLVGSEVASGLSPSVARLKVVGEAEAAGATAIPKSFWDKWFDRQRQSYIDRRKTIRSHLQSRALAGQGATTEPEPTESGDDPLGIK